MLVYVVQVLVGKLINERQPGFTETLPFLSSVSGYT